MDFFLYVFSQFTYFNKQHHHRQQPNKEQTQTQKRNNSEVIVPNKMKEPLFSRDLMAHPSCGFRRAQSLTCPRHVVYSTHDHWLYLTCPSDLGCQI